MPSAVPRCIAGERLILAAGVAEHDQTTEGSESFIELSAELATHRIDDHIHTATIGNLGQRRAKLRCEDHVRALPGYETTLGVAADDAYYPPSRVNGGKSTGGAPEAATGTEYHDVVAGLQPSQMMQRDPRGDAVNQHGSHPSEVGSLGHGGRHPGASHRDLGVPTGARAATEVVEQGGNWLPNPEPFHAYTEFTDSSCDLDTGDERQSQSEDTSTNKVSTSPTPPKSTSMDNSPEPGEGAGTSTTRRTSGHQPLVRPPTRRCRTP